MKGVYNRIPCSVSQELVDMVAGEFPRFKNPQGEIDITNLLFSIGFKIDITMKNRGYYQNFDVFIRDSKLPSKLYKSKCVYNGEVRNTVLRVNTRGEIIYTRNKHPLAYLYEQTEVLQPNDLRSIIPDEEFQDIIDIGDPTVYDRAFLIKNDKQEDKDQF